jgi:hypothetical protein
MVPKFPEKTPASLRGLPRFARNDDSRRGNPGFNFLSKIRALQWK